MFFKKYRAFKKLQVVKSSLLDPMEFPNANTVQRYFDYAIKLISIAYPQSEFLPLQKHEIATVTALAEKHFSKLKF